MKCSEIKVMTVRECATEARITTPQAVKDFWDTEIAESSWYQPDKEMFVVIGLSSRNHIKAYNLVSMGIVDASLVHAREVFRPAIISGCSGIIICHTHPSGDTTPSAEDVRITKQLVEAGKIVDIKVMDHVIIGNNVFSLRENGMVTFV